MRKLFLTLSFAAALSMGTVTVGMAAAPLSLPAESQEIDKEWIHISTVVDLISGLPNDYGDFEGSDIRDFDRAKELWDELSRDEMFRLLDHYEDTFDLYNHLYAQEKLS